MTAIAAAGEVAGAAVRLPAAVAAPTCGPAVAAVIVGSPAVAAMTVRRPIVAAVTVRHPTVAAVATLLVVEVGVVVSVPVKLGAAVLRLRAAGRAGRLVALLQWVLDWQQDVERRAGLLHAGLQGVVVEAVGGGRGQERHSGGTASFCGPCGHSSSRFPPQEATPTPTHKLTSQKFSFANELATLEFHFPHMLGKNNYEAASRCTLGQARLHNFPGEIVATPGLKNSNASLVPGKEILIFAELRQKGCMLPEFLPRATHDAEAPKSWPV